MVSNKKREITFKTASTIEFFLFIIKTKQKKTPLPKTLATVIIKYLLPSLLYQDSMITYYCCCIYGRRAMRYLHRKYTGQVTEADHCSLLWVSDKLVNRPMWTYRL